MDSKILKCETCFKTYKTKNGLIRHHNAKHVITENYNIEPTHCSTSTPIDEVKQLQVVNTLSQDNLTQLLNEIQEDLSVDECFTPELRDAIKKYNFLDSDNQLLLAMKNIQEKYIKKCDADEYYLVFYSDIVISCSSNFKGLRLHWLQPIWLIKCYIFPIKSLIQQSYLTQIQSVTGSTMDYNI